MTRRTGLLCICVELAGCYYAHTLIHLVVSCKGYFSLIEDVNQNSKIDFWMASLILCSYLPEVDDNVDARVEDQQKVGDDGQHIAPAGS